MFAFKCNLECKRKKNMVSYYKNCAPLENRIFYVLGGFFAASYQSRCSVFTEALHLAHSWASHDTLVSLSLHQPVIFNNYASQHANAWLTCLYIPMLLKESPFTLPKIWLYALFSHVSQNLLAGNPTSTLKTLEAAVSNFERRTHWL